MVEVESEIWNSKDPTILLVLMLVNNYLASREAGGPGSAGVVSGVALYLMAFGEFSAAIAKFWIAGVVDFSIAVAVESLVAVVVESLIAGAGQPPAAVGDLLEVMSFGQGAETLPH